MITWTEQVAGIIPSTGLSEKGSNVLSGRLIKSGFNKYLQWYIQYQFKYLDNKYPSPRFQGHLILNEWLLFNANWAIFQLYRGEYKLISNKMMMRSALY
jgi:hypothetical protein